LKREVKKNLDLLDEFLKYAFDHPEILDAIPRERTLVTLPDGRRGFGTTKQKDLAPLKGRRRKNGHGKTQSYQAQSLQGRLNE
jgi:hypothetical protein